MKELSIEEKAKAYDKALADAKYYYKQIESDTTKNVLEEMFHELNERDSEDEKIRKALIEMVHDTTGDSLWVDYDVHKEDALSWLEKQGEKIDAIENFDTEFEKQVSCLIASVLSNEYEYTESFVKWVSNSLLGYAKHEIEKQGEQKSEIDQHSLPVSDDSSLPTFDESIYHPCTEKVYEQKSSEWSEDDETTRNNISHIIRQYDKISKRNNQPCWYVGDCLLWMQNIKERVQPQSKQEWSEEDEYHKRQILRILKDNGCSQTLQEKTEKWIEERLKSLRPQNTWKPSEGQLECLGYAIEKAEKDWSPLTNNRIYLTLKALKEQLLELRGSKV